MNSAFRKIYELISDDIVQREPLYAWPKTWEEFTAQLHQKVERLPLNAPTIPRQIRSALYRAEDYDFFAYYILPEPLDYRHLNNVLYQVSRRTLLYFSIQGSGSDHCSAFVHTLNCFASNDFAVIDHIFPKALPLSQDPRYLGPRSIFSLSFITRSQTSPLPLWLRRSDSSRKNPAPGISTS
jgi:hypothetical protein